MLRPARYLDEEEVEFGELHIFVGPDFVVTIRHAETQNLARTRIRAQEQPELLRHGSEAVLYAILDGVVDEYEPVVNGLENDIDEIEDQLFGISDDDQLSKRIYDLSREVITFQRFVHPHTGMLTALERGAEKYLVDEELAALLRDVKDHTIRINERIDSFRAILDNALTVHSVLVARRQTEVSIRQNEEVKTISSWAAIIFAPRWSDGLRHELRRDARTALGVRLPDGRRPHARDGSRPVRDLQVAEMAIVTVEKNTYVSLVQCGLQVSYPVGFQDHDAGSSSDRCGCHRKEGRQKYSQQYDAHTQEEDGVSRRSEVSSKNQEPHTEDEDSHRHGKSRRSEGPGNL